MSHKKKRNIIIGVLCGVLLLMVVGYAAFSSVLNIKGTSNVSSNWNIKITSITSKTLSGNATNVKEPEGVGTLTASFETNLESPGDSIEYTITISNSGDINAKLDKITLSEPDNEYVTFETSGLTEGEPLNTGSTADLKVIVTFKDVEINKMDTSTSNLKVQLDFSQANVDENGIAIPPKPTLTIEDLMTKEVTEGDGLYIDTYEEGRYVYKGANPDNYITLNNELWRIIAIESDKSLKIIRNSGYYTKWHTDYNGYWELPAKVNEYFNDTYYNSLNSGVKRLIQEHTWGIGTIKDNNTDLAAQIQSENSSTWTGNIGLMSVSDVIRSNSDIENCGTFYLNWQHNQTCKTTRYLNCGWTITRNGGKIYFVHGIGTIESENQNSAKNACPSVYLIPDITLSGSGTETDPYTIN